MPSNIDFVSNEVRQTLDDFNLLYIHDHLNIDHIYFQKVTAVLLQADKAIEEATAEFEKRKAEWPKL